MRDGVVLLFYDICTKNKNYRQEYHNFAKRLKREGYVPLQESVFFKYIRNVSMAKYEVERIREAPLTQSNVLCLVLSYRVFQKMIAIQGDTPDFDLIKSAYIYL